jgi:hypothetical protein
MKIKSIDTNVAIDVQKFGAPHSGSPLMNPFIQTGGGAGAVFTTDWVPKVYYGGAYEASQPSEAQVFSYFHTCLGAVGLILCNLTIYNWAGYTDYLGVEMPFTAYSVGAFSAVCILNAGGINCVAAVPVGSIVELRKYDGSFLSTYGTQLAVYFSGFVRLDI